jgi:hypothetical protein
MREGRELRYTHGGNGRMLPVNYVGANPRDAKPKPRGKAGLKRRYDKRRRG